MPWKKLNVVMEANHTRMASKAFLVFAIGFGAILVYIGWQILQLGGNMSLMRNVISIGDMAGLVTITFTCLLMTAVLDVKADVLELKEEMRGEEKEKEAKKK